MRRGIKKRNDNRITNEIQHIITLFMIPMDYFGLLINREDYYALLGGDHGNTMAHRGLP